MGGLHQPKPKDEVALRRSHRDLSAQRSSISGDQIYSREPNSSGLSLGTAGTRRTVYLSEDEPAVPSAQSTGKNTPPLLVYNRISTVIGDTHKCKTPPQSASTPIAADEQRDVSGERRKGDNTKENAIWYEYGCV